MVVPPASLLFMTCRRRRATDECREPTEVDDEKKTYSVECEQEEEDSVVIKRQ